MLSYKFNDVSTSILTVDLLWYYEIYLDLKGLFSFYAIDDIFTSHLYSLIVSQLTSILL